MKKSPIEPVQPEAVQLPTPTEPHPSEATHIAYSDLAAPKPKKKLHIGKFVLLFVIFGVVIAGGLLAYRWQKNRNNESSVISDYSGGLAESDPATSVITEETKAAKQFIQAIQNREANVVEGLASEALKQQVKLEAEDDTATVLSYYEGRFDGISFDTLISSIKDQAEGAEAGVKTVVFADSSSAYTVEVQIVSENNALKINGIKTELTL